jgi:outer membrane protein OmpA-like peptidoglycan-associated protein
VLSVPLAAGAQGATKPAAKDVAKPAAKAHAGDAPSKWDIFLGYSYLHPGGTVTYPNPFYEEDSAVRAKATPLAVPPTTLTGSPDDINLGGILSGAYFFNRYLGVQLEGAYHNYDSNDAFTTAAGGVIVRDPRGRWTPFAHALVGGARVHGKGGEEDYIGYFTPNTWSIDVTAGGGVDYELAHHWAIRVAQVDYEFMNPDFTRKYDGYDVGTIDINALRLSAGIVYHVGAGAAPVPVTLACSATPVAVYPGDPVKVDAVAGNLNPKLNAVYIWSGSGVTGNGTTASVDTALLAPGAYTVKGEVKEGKRGHEGMKSWETANCSASFTVKAIEPPTISCSASPSTIQPGNTSTVTAVGVSPQNRPLTYSYSAAAGAISGSGTTAAYNSAGAPTGPVAITCTTTDDKGQTATAQTSVTITAPPVVAQHTEALCSISFDKDKARPTRVDNEAKACLDEVALDLQKQPDAKVVVVGNDDASEKARIAREEKAEMRNKHIRVRHLAAERAVNTKEYLVAEKGIDPSRITVVTAPEDGQKAENYLVPAGADFSADVQATTPVSETVVKPVVRKPLPVRKHAKKHAKKADK